eukprot:TRINITY_DN7804_c0_g2_i3.p1 TRINITY_DN7804_c0_g2~~TRINITY_DN7804_c0_g2_i3.p1  ORF type:complete len:222 (-),score=24.65 TRINITY_DN7804_c0_g2_i3:225-890(-)
MDIPTEQGTRKVHRFAFLQALMAKGCILEEEALQLCCKIEGQQVSPKKFQQLYKAKINDNIIQLAGLQIKSLRYPVNKKTYIALVNTKSDSASKLGTTLTYSQITFFRTILEALATADEDEINENGYVEKSSTDLFNLDMSHGFQTTSTQNGSTQSQRTESAYLSLSDKQKLLKQLVEKKWLESVHTGYYCIGVRSFLELGSMLMEFELCDTIRQKWRDFL